MSEHLLLGLTAIVVLGIGAQWLAWRFRLPSILLLLLAGLLAGPVTGVINPDEVLGELLFPVVSVSVAIILFEGGLTLRFSELPKLGGVIFRLISIGALVTWAIAAVSAHFIMQLDWELSVLLGAILVVTGPTVIGPMLRQIRPKGKAGAALKWEGILIDPVGAVLAVLIFEAIIGGDFAQATGVVLSGVLSTLLIGVGLGVIGAAAMIFLLSRYLIPDHLESSVTLLFVVLAFAISDLLHPESGLLTVTVMGVILANQNLVSTKHIEEFKENLQVLLLGFLFILLASRLEPGVIAELGSRSLIFLAILIVIARPLAILLSTWRSELEKKERLFMAWMAPRGIVAAAVSSIFAFELIEAGHNGAEQLVPLTFLTIIGTVSFYGLTAGPVARLLDLSEEDPQGVLIVGAHPFARAIARVLQNHGFVAKLLDTNWRNIKEGRMQGLDTHYGNALSEEVFEELDLTGVGRLLAMTSNNEVNSLAAVHFQEAFSRAEVYQLPMRSVDGPVDSNVVTQPNLTGRFLFGPEMTCDYLAERLRQGAVVKATPLTETFDYVDFQTRYEQEAIPLFVITSRNKLGIYTTDYQPIPRPGQILISLVEPLDKELLQTGERELSLETF
ncbi:MAG: cation:proton antiporter [Chloroflexota bacterium]